MHFLPLILVALVAVLSSCGVDSAQEAKETALVAADASIPGNQGAKGERGEKGDVGAPGVNGKDGLNGRDGKDGVNGRDGRDGLQGKAGEDGKPVGQNQWYDPTTDKFWLIAEKDYYSEATCSGFYRYPDTSELTQAIDRGIIRAAAEWFKIPVTEITMIHAKASASGYYAVNSLGAVTGPSAGNANYHTFCIEK